MIKRHYDNLDKYLRKQKVLILYGPRRVGKTTLLNNFLKNSNYKYRLDSGDNIRIQKILSSSDFELINEYASGYELLAIDEAQNIPDIGRGLKIITDNNPEIKIIATGSSSFEISQKIGEPLTGRKKTLVLYPISQSELRLKLNKFELREELEKYLIYGSYPEVLKTKSNKEKIDIILELVNSYLLKDILSLDKIKNSNSLYILLKLLAFQIGNQVSDNELAVTLKINVKTVNRYLDLLEKSYVIYRLNPFSRNLRNEISKKSKYYFYDTGIRNGIVENFNSIDLRNDFGQLWENFIIIERLKFNKYNDVYCKSYFRRTYEKEEIDLIEDQDGKLNAYEIKWGEQIVKSPTKFLNEYKKSEFKTINRINYLDYILTK